MRFHPPPRWQVTCWSRVERMWNARLAALPFRLEAKLLATRKRDGALDTRRSQMQPAVEDLSTSISHIPQQDQQPLSNTAEQPIKDERAKQSTEQEATLPVDESKTETLAKAKKPKKPKKLKATEDEKSQSPTKDESADKQPQVKKVSNFTKIFASGESAKTKASPGTVSADTDPAQPEKSEGPLTDRAVWTPRATDRPLSQRTLGSLVFSPRQVDCFEIREMKIKTSWSDNDPGFVCDENNKVVFIDPLDAIAYTDLQHDDVITRVNGLRLNGKPVSEFLDRKVNEWIISVDRPFLLPDKPAEKMGWWEYISTTPRFIYEFINPDDELVTPRLGPSVMGNGE